MTKLVINYRSHPEILRLPNRMFYDDELVPSANPLVARSLEAWEHLLAPGFPIVFHGVDGRDEREGSSPSWFNAQARPPPPSPPDARPPGPLLPPPPRPEHLCRAGTRVTELSSESVARLSPPPSSVAHRRMCPRAGTHAMGLLPLSSVTHLFRPLRPRFLESIGERK